MPETSMIWNLLLSIAAGSIVWWIRGINSKIDDLYSLVNKTRENIAREYALKTDVDRKQKQEIAREYALKTDVDKDLQKILDRFDRLENKLDAMITKIISEHK
jgi:archaellum component FlaC